MGMFKVSPSVKPLNQAYSSTCWLACLEMMVQWKNDKGDMSKKKSQICSLVDEKTDYWSDDLNKKGIAPYECRQVANALGLQPTGAGNYTAEIIHDILTKRGPMWVAGMWIEDKSHVIVVTGINRDNGSMQIINPWLNYDLTESPRSVSWLNARGNVWKSYEGSVMYWK